MQAVENIGEVRNPGGVTPTEFFAARLRKSLDIQTTSPIPFERRLAGNVALSSIGDLNRLGQGAFANSIVESFRDRTQKEIQALEAKVGIRR